MTDIHAPDEYCRLCGHQCLARRGAGETGRCGASDTIGFSSALLHLGEEPPLSGGGSKPGGSGTIFFTRCPLSCAFCQNWQISQTPSGREIGPDDLADVMLKLSDLGAFNINLVSPTPYVLQIAMALNLAKKRGLKLPVVYNSGGYDSLEALKIMDGLVDIYLPDAKIAPPAEAEEGDPDEVSARLLGAGDYPWVNRRALKEMFRQAGHLVMGADGLAARGLLVRHLVLPDDLARTSLMLPWLKDNFGPEIFISLMAQYHPAHKVAADNVEFRAFPGLFRHLSVREYEKAEMLALALGLGNTFVQDLDSPENYLPDFSKPDVFNS